MIALVKELKNEHSVILAILNEVKRLGILSKEGHAKLMSAKEHLLTHLKNEDRQLYPFLIKEAEGNKRLKDTLTLLAIDMADVSRVALEFFDKYSKCVLGKEFQEESESLFVLLRNRIRNEEDILYGKYEEAK